MTLPASGAAGGGGGRRVRFTDPRDTWLAETAIRAVVAVVELTPKPGLADPRDPDARHSAARAAAIRDRGRRDACPGDPGARAAESRGPGDRARVRVRDAQSPGTGTPDVPAGGARHAESRTHDGGGGPGPRTGDACGGPRGGVRGGARGVRNGAGDAVGARRSEPPARDAADTCADRDARALPAGRGARDAGDTGETPEDGGVRAPGLLLPGVPAPGTRRPAAPDPGTLRWAARALAPGLTAMAAAARRTGEPTPELRAELGAIGRSTEWTVRRAACGTRAHHGAIWVLGLLVAASALEPGAAPGELGAVVKRLAAHRDRGAPLRPSPGSAVSVRYGAAGARGEARAGLPHVRRALDALRIARDTGADESCARLDALLTVMATLQDTRVLYEAGPHGLRRVQSGARAVLDAGGTATRTGREALAAFDADLRAHALSPVGGVPLLAGALYAEQAGTAALGTAALGTAAPGTAAAGGRSAARVRGRR